MPVICKRSFAVEICSTLFVVAPSPFVSTDASRSILVVTVHVLCNAIAFIFVHRSFFRLAIHVQPLPSHLWSSPSLLTRCEEGSDKAKLSAFRSLRSKPNPFQPKPSRAFHSHSEPF
uniref:Uncharacterized protein n=1 Tax=Cucumis melo TaxID=3656 RepID=A0A9I9CY00_CUCME